MMPEEPIVREFMEIVLELAPTSGLDHLSATIIGILFLEPEEISMEALVHKTGYSKASISQKIKSLVTLGIIRRRNRPGSRKVYLYMEKDIIAIWKEHIKRHFMAEIRVVKEKVPAIIEKYEDSADTPEQIERLRILKNYYNQVARFEAVINKIYEDIDELTRKS